MWLLKKKKKVQINLRGVRESTSVAFLFVGVRAICLGLSALMKYLVSEYKFANITIDMQGQLRFLKKNHRLLKKIEGI